MVRDRSGEAVRDDFEGDASVPRDSEAYQYWLDVGVPAERIFELGAKDNFWAMGETGPCGPCSEIYYDFGREAAEDPSIDKPFPEDEQRYVEIWNLVFMQFDRAGDGTLTPLPKPSIDTGMGLERIACVLQGVLSNYDTDLFVPLIKRAAELTLEPTSQTRDVGHPVPVADERGAASLRIIADHARCATFLISDGVTPANEGRGYVLRKIMRRGIRHGRLLGQEKPFLHEMVFAVRDEMSDAYPELKESAERVAKVVLAEEQQFARTLELGLRQMNEETLRSGAAAFHLYETFGMPLDFMVDAARDAGIAFDMEGFRGGAAGGAGAGAGELEGWVAEVGGAGVSRVGEDGV